MSPSKRDEALALAEEILGDVELARLGPVDVARKTGRLARLLDDTAAMQWIVYEIAGFPQKLDGLATAAATTSNRTAPHAEDGSLQWWTRHLAGITADAEAARTELANSAGDTSSSEYAAVVERQKSDRKRELANIIAAREELVQKIVGSFYDYAAAKYQELRFGAAVQTAFEVVRSDVDSRIAALVPDALPKLSAALENTTSDNPEDWASAAATCRRLLKAAADAIRPPGPVKNNRVMDDEHYINRIVDWIITSSASRTAADLVAGDLEYLGRRLDAVLDAGHKGVHAEVSRFDASRFVTGTYLLLGDILRIAEPA